MFSKSNYRHLLTSILVFSENYRAIIVYLYCSAVVETFTNQAIIGCCPAA